MPQMAPYNWLLMFILFNIMLFFYSCYNNFLKNSFLNKPENPPINSYKWKW